MQKINNERRQTKNIKSEVCEAEWFITGVEKKSLTDQGNPASRTQRQGRLSLGENFGDPVRALANKVDAQVRQERVAQSGTCLYTV